MGGNASARCLTFQQFRDCEKEYLAEFGRMDTLDYRQDLKKLKKMDGDLIFLLITKRDKQKREIWNARYVSVYLLYETEVAHSWGRYSMISGKGQSEMIAVTIDPMAAEHMRCFMNDTNTLCTIRDVLVQLGKCLKKQSLGLVPFLHPKVGVPLERTLVAPPLLKMADPLEASVAQQAFNRQSHGASGLAMDTDAFITDSCSEALVSDSAPRRHHM